MLSPQASRVEEADRERRFLIAAGTAKYEMLTDDAQLPSVVDDLALIIELFTRKLGYEQILPELAANPTTQELRLTLSAWFKAPERRSTDVVVFYYSGHGGVAHRSHYLLASDSDDENLIGTAFRTADLALMLWETPIRNLLVLFDTCQSGQGINDFSSIAAEVIGSLGLREMLSSGIYAIAATRPKGEADQGVFAKAFVRAVESPNAKYASNQQPFLIPITVVKSINEEFGNHQLRQRARANSPVAEDIPRFIPNLRCVSETPVEIDLKTPQQLVSEYSRELITIWGPSARGVEIESQLGSYFTGRTDVLVKLVIWLTEPQFDRRAYVVTGSPGSGKSAVLSRLVTLSDPKYRLKVSLAGVPKETIPPQGSIHIAIHAKGKTLENIAASIAVAGGAKENSPLLLADSLSQLQAPLIVVIDALDEAIEPERIARQLLHPLTLVPKIHMLVGTRKNYLSALGPSKVVVDLDDPKYIDRRDITEYVSRRLLAAEDSSSPTPYRNKSELAREVARAVAEKAYPIFLIARLLSEELIQADDPLDISQPDWRNQFPSTVGGAFDEFLARFGQEEERIRDLLKPLAYAEGPGLPWEDLWAPLASALSGKAYTDSDIEWLLKRAGSYIIQGIEPGWTFYRLYHEALANHLQRKGQRSEIHRRFTKTLIEWTPDLIQSDGKDWLTAHPYVRKHLAAHAAAAGRLGALVSDPLYLLAADPDRLLPALSIASGKMPREVVHVYQLAVAQMTGRPVAEAASYLEMAARQSSAQDFANRVALLPLSRPWSVLWAHWQPACPHRVITLHQDGPVVVAVGELYGRPVVVSGSYAKTIQLTDLAHGMPLGEPLVGHDGPVTSVAVGKLEGRPVIVSGSQDSTIRIWDLADHTPVGAPLRGHEGAVESVTFSELDSQPMIVSGSQDNTIRVWDPVQGMPLGEPLVGHDGAVTSVAVGKLEGRPVIVSGSQDSTIRIWDLADHTPVGAPLRGHKATVTSVAVGELKGRLVVVSGSQDAMPRIWEFTEGMPDEGSTAGFFMPVESVAIGDIAGRPVFVIGGSMDHGIRIREFSERRLEYNELRGHQGPAKSLALYEFAGQPFLISGGFDSTVRVWNLAQINAEKTSFPADDGSLVVAVMFGVHASKPVVLTVNGFGSNRAARIWDMRVWELTEGSPVCGSPVLDKHMNEAAALGEVGGRPVFVCCRSDGTVESWDMLNRERVGKNLATRFGEITALAVGELGGRPVIVSGSIIGTVQVWDLVKGKRIGKPRQVKASVLFVTAVTVGKLAGRSVIVSSLYGGTVQVWDSDYSTYVGEPFEVGSNRVTALAVGEIASQPVIVTGDDKGTIRVWRLGGKKEREINLGATINDIAFGQSSTLAVATSMGLVVFQLAHI